MLQKSIKYLDDNFFNVKRHGSLKLPPLGLNFFPTACFSEAQEAEPTWVEICILSREMTKKEAMNCQPHSVPVLQEHPANCKEEKISVSMEKVYLL